jgi:predicted nucleic acid-binding protein
VLAEIVLPDQKQQVDGALAVGILRIEELSSPDGIALFVELRHLMGAGEASSLALAIHKGWVVASDEKRAFRREALARLGPCRLLTTPGLYVLAIRAGLLSVAEADADKARLEAWKFKLGFSTVSPAGGQRNYSADRVDPNDPCIDCANPGRQPHTGAPGNHPL